MKEYLPLILIADDMELNRELLKDMLQEEYRIIDARNGREAVEILEQRSSELSILLLDVIMPEIDGFEVLSIMRSRGWIENIPVIMISAETSPDFISKGYQLGAADYVSRPFDSNIIKRRLENTIVLHNKQKQRKQTASEQFRQKERNNALMINILSTIVEFRNGEPGLHVLRIRSITEILLVALIKRFPKYSVAPEEVAIISNAAALHDVGKIVIPESILNKPGRLTDHEFEIMKTHAARGAEMLDSLRIGRNEVLVRYAHSICRWHHERWDGRGYPDGLCGDAIPLCAQIVALADVYAALTCERVYKPCYSHEEAVQMILNGECGVFNPEMIQCLAEEAATLEDRIRLHSENLDLFCDLDSPSEDLMSHKGTNISDHTLFLLEQERTKNQFLAALSSDMLFDYDAQADTVTVSEKGSQDLGLKGLLYPASIQFASSPLLSAVDKAQLLDRVRSSSPENPRIREQYLFCLPNGQQRWYELTAQSLWSNELTPTFLGCLGKLVDIHKQKMTTSRLMEQLQRDSLTKLYNHATARELVETSIQTHPEQRSALFFIDVDDFKAANDGFGHIFGDQLLQHIADTLFNSIRNTDIAARVGGDEFVLYLENMADSEKIQEYAKHILSTIATTYMGYSVSISIGIARYPKDGILYPDLLNHADQALYASKRNGKNQFAFYDEAWELFPTLLSPLDAPVQKNGDEL